MKSMNVKLIVLTLTLFVGNLYGTAPATPNDGEESGVAASRLVEVTNSKVPIKEATIIFSCRECSRNIISKTFF